MSGRPVDWQPLADSDPIGGDVDAVAAEGRYYSGLAQEISDQVGRLRAITHLDGLVGKSADELRSSAGTMADTLEKTHGRVYEVGSALTAWVPHLEQAQAETAAALIQAQDAQAVQSQHRPAPAGTPAPTTDAQKQAETDRARSYAEASGRLAAARTRMSNAVDERNSQASAIAGQIKGALHDGLKDGFWDHISHWVSQHVKLIKMIVEIVGWVATALSIASIFFPFLLPFALALTALTMLGHALLASTGNGSWFEVALDAFALVTLGAGGALGALAKGGRLAAVGEAADIESTAARTGVMATRAAEKTVLRQATSNVFKRFLTKDGWQAAKALRGFDAATSTLADAAASTARAAGLARGLPEVSKMESLLGSGKDFAENVKDLRALKDAYPLDKVIASKVASAVVEMNINRVAASVASTADLTNHVLSHSTLPLLDRLPYSQGWENLKDVKGEAIGKALHLPGVH